MSSLSGQPVSRSETVVREVKADRTKQPLCRRDYNSGLWEGKFRVAEGGTRSPFRKEMEGKERESVCVRAEVRKNNRLKWARG